MHVVWNQLTGRSVSCQAEESCRRYDVFSMVSAPFTRRRVDWLVDETSGFVVLNRAPASMSSNLTQPSTLIGRVK